MDARIVPEGSLDILSRTEARRLRDAGYGGLYGLWRQCSLAVLNAGTEEDDINEILERHRDFRISIEREEGGIAVVLENAPDGAFVEGKMIRGIREHLFAVLRDLLYAHETILQSRSFARNDSTTLTDAVFKILRNARVLKPEAEPNLVVCWGGHAIGRSEYDYTKRVGYSLGLRALDVCTGCGAGAMKGPMKGAALGHAKQRRAHGRYVGLTEPTIIAVEAPNPIVSELVILPDMEKRLEAFLRIAHGIVIFPGGVGTAEELLYLVGILLDPANRDVELPVVLTGPTSSRPYFDLLTQFISETIGPEALGLLTVIIDDSDRVGHEMAVRLARVRASRREHADAFFFNWRLKIDLEFQTAFVANHDTMAALDLTAAQPVQARAVNLRRAFAGIVAGNVREEGVRLVHERGPFELHGDPSMINALNRLLDGFIAERRMKLTDPASYRPCFRFAS